MGNQVEELKKELETEKAFNRSNNKIMQELEKTIRMQDEMIKGLETWNVNLRGALKIELDKF